MNTSNPNVLSLSIRTNVKAGALVSAAIRPSAIATQSIISSIRGKIGHVMCW